MVDRRTRIEKRATLTTKVWCTKPEAFKNEKNSPVKQSPVYERRQTNPALDHPTNANDHHEINIPAGHDQPPSNAFDQSSSHRQSPAGMNQDDNVFNDELQGFLPRQDLAVAGPSTPDPGPYSAEELLDWEWDSGHAVSPVKPGAAVEPNSFMRTIIEHETATRTHAATPRREAASHDATTPGLGFYTTPDSANPPTPHEPTPIEHVEILSDSDTPTPPAPVKDSWRPLRNWGFAHSDEDEENRAPASPSRSLQQERPDAWENSQRRSHLQHPHESITSFQKRLRDAGISPSNTRGGTSFLPKWEVEFAPVNEVGRTSSSSSSSSPPPTSSPSSLSCPRPPVRNFQQRLRDAGISSSNPRGHTSFILRKDAGPSSPSPRGLAFYLAQRKSRQDRQGSQGPNKSSSTRTLIEQLPQSSTYPARKRNQRRGVFATDQPSPLETAAEVHD